MIRIIRQFCSLGKGVGIIWLMKKGELINRLRTEGQKLFRRYPVALAYLFGSYAQGESRKNSDVDLAVVLDDSVAKNQYFDLGLKLAGEIGKLLKTDNFDLVILNHEDISPVLKFEAVYRGILIYSCLDFNRRFEFENRVRKEFYDTAHFRQAAFQALLARAAENRLARPLIKFSRSK